MAPQVNSDMDEYWKAKGFKESARLYLQHWLFQGVLEYSIHPSIAEAITARKELRIADLACGNGAWLIEVNNKYPSAQLRGFDFQPVHFPSSHVLPSNIKLIEQDILHGSWSDDLIGIFDLVHIRAFSSIIKDNNIKPVVEIAKKLLKPGGYLQWDESDSAAMTASAPEGQSLHSCQTLLGLMAQVGKQTGILFDWCHDPKSYFAKEGLSNIMVDIKFLKPQYLKAWTENYLLVYEEVAGMVPSEKNAPESPLTREKYLGLFNQVVKETVGGAVIHPERILVVTSEKT